MSDSLEEKIDSGQIAKTPMEGASPSNEYIAVKEAEHTFANNQLEKELGFLGRIAGGRGEKPGNVSAFVVAAAFFLIGVCITVVVLGWFYTINPSGLYDVVERIFFSLVSLITLALGYLFGSTDNRSDK